MGDDGPPACRVSEQIFADIAAMKAGSPIPRKMRAMPAWITPAVWVPDGRQGAGSASPSRACLQSGDVSVGNLYV
jgi:hypothetical protein